MWHLCFAVPLSSLAGTVSAVLAVPDVSRISVDIEPILDIATIGVVVNSHMSLTGLMSVANEKGVRT